MNRKTFSSLNFVQTNCSLFQAYHSAHLEAIKGFGMHGYEMDFEILVEEYQVRVHCEYKRREED